MIVGTQAFRKEVSIDVSVEGSTPQLQKWKNLVQSLIDESDKIDTPRLTHHGKSESVSTMKINL